MKNAILILLFCPLFAFCQQPRATGARTITDVNLTVTGLLTAPAPAFGQATFRFNSAGFVFPSTYYNGSIGGLHVGWNISNGGGETNFTNAQTSAIGSFGGFEFGNITTSGLRTTIATINAAGNLTTAGTIKPGNLPSLNNAPNVMVVVDPSTGTLFSRTLSQVASDIAGGDTPPQVLSTSSTLALNTQYALNSASQILLTLPPTQGFAIDGKKTINITASATGGGKVIVPSGYNLRGISGATKTDGTGYITLAQYQQLLIKPDVAANSFIYQMLSGTGTVN